MTTRTAVRAGSAALAALCWLLAPASVFADGPLSDPETAKYFVFFLVGGGGVLIGLLLYKFAQRSSQEAYQRDEAQLRVLEQSKKQTGVGSILAKELSRLGVDPRDAKDVVKSVTDIVTKTTTEEVEAARKRVNDEYGRIIEDQRRATATLQRKYQDTLKDKQQTSAVLESIAEGLVVVNDKGEVVMMNPAAEKLLAIEQREGIGKPLLDQMGDEQLVSLVNETKPGDREIILTAKQDSTKKVLRASNAMITDENGKTVGMVAVLSDVTKQRELDQLKSEFVSKVSHELRTPLVAMQHSLSLIQDEVAGPLSEEQKKFLGISRRNLDRLNNLINDLLDLSKLEAKKMEMHAQPGPIEPVIRHVCESLEAWAGSKQVSITRRVPDDLPEGLFDQARVTQVLTNLVGNSLKFTPKQGRITLEAKRSEDGSSLEVSVQDTGPGIAKEDLGKLFNKFQQVGERSASDISGTGLGLAISKEIVELHKGRIWVESEINQGARFVFTLPVASAKF